MRRIALMAVLVAVLAPAVGAGARPAAQQGGARIVDATLVRSGERVTRFEVHYRQSLGQLTTASVAIGLHPRVVMGFVDDQISSPLRGSVRDPRLHVGQRVRVVLTLCATAIVTPKTTARTAKRSCDRKAFASTSVTITR